MVAESDTAADVEMLQERMHVYGTGSSKCLRLRFSRALFVVSAHVVRLQEDRPPPCVVS